MADEIKISAMSLVVENDGSRVIISSPEQSISFVALSEKRHTHSTQKVTTTDPAVALDLGRVTTPGMCMIRNHSGTPGGTTYIVQIRTSTSGTAMVELRPKETQVFRFGSGVTAPCVISTTAGTEIEYVIVEK